MDRYFSDFNNRTAVFVAKREIADWPVFGFLARLQHSVFVDRNRRQKTKEVNLEIADRLMGGDLVVLFAEGTSSDGNRVLPFRSALIGAAGEAAIQGKDGASIFIQPLSIAYVGFQGLPMGRQHRHRASWYGGADLLPHLRAVLRDGAIDVVLTWGEPIAFAAASNRKEVARMLETKVRELTGKALRTGLQMPDYFTQKQGGIVKAIVEALWDRAAQHIGRKPGWKKIETFKLLRSTIERQSNA